MNCNAEFKVREQTLVAVTSVHLLVEEGKGSTGVNESLRAGAVVPSVLDGAR